MALIQCPECGKDVSSNAKQCIHCGSPLGTPDYSLKVQLGDTSKVIGGTMIQTAAKMTYTFTNDETGEVLAVGNQHQTVTINVSQPTTIRCHVTGGFKDAVLNYIPREDAKYRIIVINTLFNARIEFQEVGF